MKKAVFFDVDGTLIDISKGMMTMSTKTKKTIRQLQDAGHYTFIASGRPFAFLDKEITEFGFDGYVLMNGAAVIMGDQVLYKKPLDKAYVASTCKKCDAHQVEYILQGTKHVYLKPEFKQLDDFYEDIEIAKNRFVYDFDATNLDVYKMEFISKNEQGLDVCMSFVNDKMEFMTDPRHKLNFELYAKAQTKATGIQRALQALDIPLENSYAFGDGKNDKEMLAAVGYGFAMDNADASLKKIADYTVDSVHHDGVAQGILDYIL